MAKKPIDPIKVKARKQKKIAIGGGVLLLLLVVIQGPKLFKQVHGGSSTPAWLAQSRQDTANGVTPAPAADPTAAPVAPTGAVPVAPTGSGSLVADSAPAAGMGQLATFDGFASKDPFDVQVPAGGGTGTATAGGSAPGSSTEPPTPPSPPASPGTNGAGSGTGTGAGAGAQAASPPAQQLLSAVIAVNGVKGLVATGADFPAAAPFFHLVSAAAHTAKITIAGGSYASGAAALTLHERKPVTLMNTADGTRYTLELFPQGTPVAAAATTAASTGPSSTTQSTTAATTTSSG
jgi:hypothetical protein